MSADTNWGQQPPLPDAQPPDAPTDSPPLRRSRQDRVLGGVCGGLGAYLGIDPLWLRLAFVALTLGAGSGVLLYVIAWIVIPEAGADEVPTARTGTRPQGAALVGGGLILLGVILLVERVAPWMSGLFWPTVLLVAGVAVILTAVRR